MTNAELITAIDAMPYEELLRRWRFSKLSDQYMCGQVGVHFRETMYAKRDLLPRDEQVMISKKVGWIG